MKISTRGIYALRLMIFLAQQNSENPVPLKEVTQKTGISRKYLEQIAALLSTAGLVKSSRGASGGYRLAQSPSKISVLTILNVTEATLAPVDYVDDLTKEPDHGQTRYEVFVWRGLHEVITEYLRSITLQDIIDKSCELDADLYSI